MDFNHTQKEEEDGKSSDQNYRRDIPVGKIRGAPPVLMEQVTTFGMIDYVTQVQSLGCCLSRAVRPNFERIPL